jgi:hypothetical protein
MRNRRNSDSEDMSDFQGPILWSSFPAEKFSDKFTS